LRRSNGTLSVQISIQRKICLLSADIISMEKKSESSKESLLFHVAVAHQIIIVQSENLVKKLSQ
jgi:hypothetical protein